MSVHVGGSSTGSTARHNDDYGPDQPPTRADGLIGDLERLDLPRHRRRRPRTSSGALAGSTFRLDGSVAHAASLGANLVDALAAATRQPANLLRRRDVGRISPGARADLIWLDDNPRTQPTWINGHLADQR
jgi:N-acetylglucosamine-6-phosphate deacetylase